MPIDDPLNAREKRMLRQVEPTLSNNPPGIDLPEVLERFRDGVQAEIDAQIGGVDEAFEISYDNTTSGLTGTDVQAAIDELATGGADPAAIHDNVAGEIAAITEKLVPVNADLLLIEDSAAANVKKRVQVGNLPSGSGNMSTTTYDPTGVGGDSFDADNHAYDNATSGLAATNTQAAIDEIEARVDANDAKESAIMATRAVNTTGPILTTDGVVTSDASGGNIALTLPTAIGNQGKRFFFKRMDGSANSLTIQTVLSQTIDGVTSTALSAQYESIELVSDGANWLIIG